MRDKFNWVYLIMTMVTFGLMLVSIYKGEDETAFRLLILNQICIIHIKLNEIKWEMDRIKVKQHEK